MFKRQASGDSTRGKEGLLHEATTIHAFRHS
jgi:hypothetical protein